MADAQTKTERVIREYGLGAIGADLEAYWTGEGERRHSLRELAALFNRRVLRAAMERAGVDMDALFDDFVSHQAIHTYLRQSRNAEYERGGDQVEKDAETLGRLRSRAAAVSERTLERLRDTGRIDLGAFDVHVDVRVFCEDCGTERGVIELLRDGGCACGDD